jgi:hypothetical protein
MLPGESLYVYQRVFVTPGAKFQEDIYQHLEKPLSGNDMFGKVQLKFLVAEAVYISNIKVSCFPPFT